MASDAIESTESQTEMKAVESSFFRSEDWLAMVFGFSLLLVGLGSIWLSRPDAQSTTDKLAKHKEVSQELKELAKNPEDYKSKSKELIDARKKLESEIAPTPLKPWIVKMSGWVSNPLEAFYSKKQGLWAGLAVTFTILAGLYAAIMAVTGNSWWKFVRAFAVVFVLAIIAFLMGGQKTMEVYNLEYALWALLVGLFISNTIGTPRWLEPAMRTELYIKSGLILLGAEVLFNKLLALGGPGIFVSWVTTPIVLVATYLFGQYILRIQSKSLNLVISADMSVCGVSAAIATAAACKAKKEELSLAIGLSLGFTVLMIIVMPPMIRWMGLSDVVGGAWIGGTVDSTGAVAAAGEMLGTTAMEVATTVKMIQNILIGVVALGVAVYWSTFVEKGESAKATIAQGPYLIWRRFPKFVLGFMVASLFFSWLQSTGTVGQLFANGAVDGFTKNLRVWLFCLGFVSIGLDSNLKEFMKLMHGGKPLVLYVVGQGLNLVVSLAMCWLMFEVVFKDVAASLAK